MRAGNLRHYVKIEEASVVRDDYGGESKTWGTVAGLGQVPASFRSLRGREMFDAQAINNSAQVEFRFRYQENVTSQLTETMRIVYDGKYYNILDILPDMTRRRELVVTCERGLTYVTEQNNA